MSESRSHTPVSRRTLAKGAAWTAPALVIVSATPAMAGSPGGCSDCTVTLAAGGASTAAVVNNTGTLIVAGAFTASALGCTGLVAAGVATTTNATLTMSDGATYTTTLNLGVGPMVAGVVALANGVAFPGVHFPDGLYLSAAGIGLLPVYPTRICFDFTIPLQLLGGPVTDCSQRLCFVPTFVNANLGVVSGITHDGSVTFGTVWVGA